MSGLLLGFFIVRLFKLLLNDWRCLLSFSAVLLIIDGLLHWNNFLILVLMQTLHEVVHDVYVGELGLLLVSLLFDLRTLLIWLCRVLLLLLSFWLQSLLLTSRISGLCRLLLFLATLFTILLRGLQLLVRFYFLCSSDRGLGVSLPRGAFSPSNLVFQGRICEARSFSNLLINWLFLKRGVVL
jgi:hypothetical protein